MKHQNGAILAVTKRPNPTVFQKTLAFHDFYWADEDFEFPMGAVQLLGKSNKDQLLAETPLPSPGMALVLDVNCRAHDLDNLYVVDGSFFVSSAAVNPASTIMANGLRVGEHLLERFT